MTDSEQEFGPTTQIGKQAADIIDEDTDWIELAQSLDVESYTRRDPMADDGNATPFRRMFLAYLWVLVEDDALSAVPRLSNDDPELARAFGFDPADMPDPSTFRRLRNNRFEDLKSTLQQAAKSIQNIAAEQGAPIGVELTSTNTDQDDDGEPSERTVDRMLRRKGGEVLQEMKNTVIPAMSLPRPEDPIYEDNELLVLAAIAAIKTQAARGAGKSLGDEKNPNPDKEDPFYEDGPCGETLLEAIKEMSVDEIATVMNFALRKAYTRAKPKLEALDNFDTNVMLAIDITYVAYWGETEGLEWLQGAPDDKEYRWCHKFATAAIVGENTHYVVAVQPLGSVEHTDNDTYPGNEEQSYWVGDVARQLISVANEYVDIRMVYADREFAAADVFHTLEQHNLRYVIPARKNKRIKRYCARFDRLKRGYADEENDEAVYVKNDYPVRGPVKHKRANERVETNLVLLPPDEDDETHEDGSPQPFYTNTRVNDTIALDRRKTTQKIERYSNRGAIENTYKKIKNCAAWTTSTAFEVRWFHFAMGCIIYDFWLLVDFLVQDRIGVIETRTEPRVHLSRFLDWLDDEVATLI